MEPDRGAFARIVTKDATSAGFAADSCAPNLHRAFKVIAKYVVAWTNFLRTRVSIRNNAC